MDEIQQYVAFLRGINVGGHRVKMDRLRELFEDMDFSSVSTFIASGNVIFSSNSCDVRLLTDRIEQGLAEGLGYEVATFVRSPAELEAIASFEPAAGREGPSAPSVYLILLKAPPSDDLRSTLSSLSSKVDEFQFSGREIYWLIQGKFSDSNLGRDFEKATRGVPNTTRNITSIRRLVAKLGTGQATA